MLKESIEHHRLGRLDEAERGYREHLEGQPNDAEVLHLLGLLRHQRGASEEAEELLTRAHALAPDKAGIELTLGTLRFQAGDFDGARSHYEKALALDPNIGTAHAGLGQVALMRGEREDAERHFRIALRAGENAQALAGLGSLLLEREDLDAALRHLGRAADLAPNDPTIQLALGRAFAKRGTDTFAEKAFENALRVKPDLHAARQALGSLTLKAKRPREAEAHFRALLAVPGLESAGHVGLGDVARAEDRHEDAVASYRAALAIDSRQSAPARALAWSLMQAGRNAEAIQAYDDYLALVPGDHDVRTARADLLMVIGRLGESFADWRRIADDNPADMQAQSRLALLDEHLGRLSAADATAALVLRATIDPEMLLVRIRARMREGDDAGARALLDQLAEQPRTDGQQRLYWNYLGRLHDRAGDAAEAVRCFAEAQRGSPASMPPLDAPRPELELALTDAVGEPWPQAPVFLLGTPGSGVERVAALLADQPELVVLRDRIGALQRVDDFNQPRFAYYCGDLTEADRAALRERYLGPLRAAGIPLDRTLVDWLPRWDAHLLALVRRAFPGARLVIVERDPRDALVNWLGFGWARGFPCADVPLFSEWLARARDHIHYADALDEPRRIVVAADALLDDPLANGGALARFLGLDALEPGSNFAAMAHGLGGLPVRFPRGHWERYREALAAPFAALEAR
ncbi:MAG TPA: tetratricopeptide repeat protein [Rhodanobacteraceae bacterium]|nr:tetratricopeptide repeat protein [Rhodanobacteraceae bacterium]